MQLDYETRAGLKRLVSERRLELARDARSRVSPPSQATEPLWHREQAAWNLLKTGELDCPYVALSLVVWPDQLLEGGSK